MSASVFVFLLMGCTTFVTLRIVDDDWLSQIIKKSMVSESSRAYRTSSLGDKIITQLFKNKGELATEIINNVLKAREERETKEPIKASVMSKVFHRLLENEGELLSTIFAKWQTKRRINPFEKALTDF